MLLDWTTVRASSATGLGEKVQQVLAERGETSQLHSIYRGGCPGRGIWKRQAPLNERPLSRRLGQSEDLAMAFNLLKLSAGESLVRKGNAKWSVVCPFGPVPWYTNVI